MLCACIKSSAYFVNPPLRHGGKPHGGKLLKGRGVKRNSSSCYLRTLRTLYRKAVEAGLTTDKNIFRHVFTGFAKTAKRAIPLSSLRAIRLLRLPEDSVVAFARDLFMLSAHFQWKLHSIMTGIVILSASEGSRRHPRGCEILPPYSRQNDKKVKDNPSLVAFICRASRSWTLPT